MKVTYIQNGSLTMVLIPEDDMDKAALLKMNGAVLIKASETMRIMNQPLADTMLLQEKLKVPVDAGGNPTLPEAVEK